ncbi:hypothetical protein [Dyadobacter frigoris]|uniref:Uncharacterized protein n=1 Tax=Dyadobacter frigoris TaxID=2576211 RepID=A0A4U6D7Z0_9BACT|nr:hypothetical protein [Dyadobacter frigoris]TKT92665.1 hypothetical protein FDK13_07570 [Dyadobacter frigoris]
MNEFYLYTEHFCYTSIEGILWRISPFNLSNFIPEKPTESLARIVDSAGSKTIVIDWDGISNLHIHSLNSFLKKLKSFGKTALFINYAGLEKSKLTDPCKVYEINHVSIGDEILILSPNPIQNSNYKIEDIYQEIQKARNNKVTDSILNSAEFHYNGEFKPLASTPLLSNGEYNSNKIIGVPSSFFWVTFALAEKVKQIVEQYRIGNAKRPAKLISVSLRASALGAAVSMLTGIPLETINHFGPVNKPFNIEADLSFTCDYIYIGDYTIGGTEIKIAQTYAALKNSILNHGVVLASLFTSSDYEHIVKIHPLIDSLNSKIGSYSKIEFKLPS